MQANPVPSGDPELAVNDLGPLAWVLDELRKSLDGATKAIRRFVRDAELARGSDLESLDASQLRIARQQLHQAVGALEMVGLGAPAKLLRAMEALAQKFVQRPEFCSEDAAAKVERASFALSEYLEGVLRGKSASSVALFPQYRDVLELVGEERIYPADLWSIEWRWVDAVLPNPVEPMAYAPSVRTQMDSAVLKMVKTGSASSARALRDISLGLATAQQALEPRVFWKICAAFFEAMALKLCPTDVYLKRAASRVLMQYTSLARGSQEVSDRLAQDLLFFCAQAAPSNEADAPVLSAIRQAYGLSQVTPVDYETMQFGRFDPALLVQVRKRIATATETWSALAGGDTNRLKVVTDQFNLVSESLLKLHPENSELSRALLKAVEITVRSGEPPTTPVAMEVATAILYLDAAYEDMDPTESRMSERSLRLARRLDHVIAGGQPEPLEGWMEELYRRVSDRQTMGSVVEELRTALTEIEKSLDQFFRNPQDKVPLHEVPSQLAQMRGVFSVLGLDQASLATLRMRDSVEKF
jgi:chemosensory pili system protein ChpA (sensor histidine kinase/response regulator)